jgi:pimeloyl-ACP methyl ester carboxylesterase
MRNNSTTSFFAFDLPGHGYTTYCSQWFYDSHIDGLIAIRRVMRHFGWDKVSYIGHSLGGIIGFVFTSFFPE